ncbi:MAG: hypothetical protein LUC06_01775 [Oscillospiraceae bacterium]|nr:hypothetical protein [Oscillospiraceae bacterium]
MCSISPSGESRGGVSKNPNPFPERGRLGFLAFLRKKICGAESKVGDFPRRGKIVYILFIFSSKFEHGKRIKCKVHETIPPKIHRFVAAKAAAGAACDSFI